MEIPRIHHDVPFFVEILLGERFPSLVGNHTTRFHQQFSSHHHEAHLITELRPQVKLPSMTLRKAVVVGVGAYMGVSENSGTSKSSIFS